MRRKNRFSLLSPLGLTLAAAVGVASVARAALIAAPLGTAKIAVTYSKDDALITLTDTSTGLPLWELPTNRVEPSLLERDHLSVQAFGLDLGRTLLLIGETSAILVKSPDVSKVDSQIFWTSSGEFILSLRNIADGALLKLVAIRGDGRFIGADFPYTDTRYRNRSETEGYLKTQSLAAIAKRFSMRPTNLRVMTTTSPKFVERTSLGSEAAEAEAAQRSARPVLRLTDQRPRLLYQSDEEFWGPMRLLESGDALVASFPNGRVAVLEDDPARGGLEVVGEIAPPIQIKPSYRDVRVFGDDVFVEGLAARDSVRRSIARYRTANAPPACGGIFGRP